MSADPTVSSESSILIKLDSNYPAPYCPEVPGFHRGKLSSVGIGGHFLYEGKEFRRLQMPVSLGLAVGAHFGSDGGELLRQSIELEQGFFALDLTNSTVAIFTIDVDVPIQGVDPGGITSISMPRTTS